MNKNDRLYIDRVPRAVLLSVLSLINPTSLLIRLALDLLLALNPSVNVRAKDIGLPEHNTMNSASPVESQNSLVVFVTWIC